MFPRLHIVTLALTIITTASCGSNPNNSEYDSTGTSGATTGSHFDAAGVTGLSSGGGSTVGMLEGGDAPHGDATTGSRIDASTTSSSSDANSTSGGDATTTSGGSQTSTTTTGTVSTTGSQTTGVGVTSTSGGVTTSTTGTQTTTSGTTGTSTVTTGTTGRTTTTGNNPTTTGSGISSGQTTTSSTSAGSTTGSTTSSGQTSSTTGSTTTGSATTTSGNTTTSTTGIASTTGTTTGSTTTSTTGVGTTGAAATTSGMTTGSATGSTTGTPPVCSANTTRCSSSVLQTCAGDGSGWNFTTTCPFVCSGGVCIGVCVPNAIKCNGLDVQTCDGNGAWNTTSACTAPPNSTASCTGNGICGSSCNSGFADCTGAAGCETTLGTVANCASCNNTCAASAAHTSPTCTGSCEVTCDSGWKDCNGNSSDGCEKDSLNDVSNCGTCGNVCNGGICDNGTCKSPVNVGTIAALDQVYRMTTDGTNLYVLTVHGSTNSIYKMAKDGSGSTTVLYSHPSSVKTIAYANGFIFFSDGSNIDKITASVASVSPTIVAPGFTTSQLVADGNVLYWATGMGAGCFCTRTFGTGDILYKMTVTDSLPTPSILYSTSDGELQPNIVTSTNYVYALSLHWTVANGYSTDIIQVKKSVPGSLFSGVGGGFYQPNNFAAFGFGMFLTASSTKVFALIQDNGPDGENIWSIPIQDAVLTSNSAQPIVSGGNIGAGAINPTGSISVQGFVADATSLYLTFMKLPIATGVPSVFLPYSTQDMLQDNSNIYFLGIRKWASPPYTDLSTMTSTNGVFRVAK